MMDQSDTVTVYMRPNLQSTISPMRKSLSSERLEPRQFTENKFSVLLERLAGLVNSVEHVAW
jgi:hypothetical protein